MKKCLTILAIFMALVSCSKDDDESADDLRQITEYNEPCSEWGKSTEDVKSIVGEPYWEGNSDEGGILVDTDFLSEGYRLFLFGETNGTYSILYNFINDQLTECLVTFSSTEEHSMDNLNFLTDYLDTKYGSSEYSEDDDFRYRQYEGDNSNITLIYVLDPNGTILVPTLCIKYSKKN